MTSIAIEPTVCPAVRAKIRKPSETPWRVSAIEIELNREI
jgi:hypothetical protein